jgi:hypothetical protein
MDQYGTLSGFRFYHTARDRDTSIYDDTKVEAAKLVASEWLDGRYRSSFPGIKVGMRSQVREWPRNGGVDRDGYAIPAASVPTEVENAVYEATLRQLANPGSLNVDWTPPRYKSASVAGAVSVSYASFSSAADVQTRFSVIDDILAPILTGNGGDASPLSGSINRV